MNLGKVLGTVVTTQKDPNLLGVTLLVMQPLNENLENVGGIMVAADPIGARTGDIVMWVGSREASLALDEKFAPVDAAIVGLVDRVAGKSTEVGADGEIKSVESFPLTPDLFSPPESSV